MVYIPCIRYLYRSILQHTNILENMKSPTPQLGTCVLMERGSGYLSPQKFQWKANQYFQNPGQIKQEQKKGSCGTKKVLRTQKQAFNSPSMVQVPILRENVTEKIRADGSICWSDSI